MVEKKGRYGEGNGTGITGNEPAVHDGTASCSKQENGEREMVKESGSKTGWLERGEIRQTRGWLAGPSSHCRP